MSARHPERVVRAFARGIRRRGGPVFAFLLLALSPAPAHAQAAATPHEMHLRHGDPAAYIASLEDPARDAYQKPDEVMKALDLRPGEVVADIGSGPGYFTVRFARAVGDTGRVYAVDVSPDMIRYLNRRLRDEGIRNVVPVLAEPNDPLLPDASVDRVVIVDTWHHIENRPAYLALLKRMLKPGGEVVHIDFRKRDLPVGPPLGMKISREELIQQMEEAGFKLSAERTFLPYQYFLVFTVR